jgi:hypothetical protein
LDFVVYPTLRDPHQEQFWTVGALLAVFAEERAQVRLGGTGGSNPVPSSGESGANSIPGLSFDHLGSVLTVAGRQQNRELIAATCWPHHSGQPSSASGTPPRSRVIDDCGERGGAAGIVVARIR